ncbi:hypothetical protein DPMN_033057 [Dreissena polymorpha]|uniref:Uncharacterized protein n=1 Tax=Dreissena polymorpha TaxID=45954 RepID=A0A9D4M526_DREPO|nr:hypothetical protein DPMN_033057 [Dreissena polymorpha]
MSRLTSEHVATLTDARADGDGRDRPVANVFAHLRGTNILVKNVNARVFTNQMWTEGRRTKTNPKTSPEQSAIFQIVREINKTNAKNVTSGVFDHRKTAPPPWRPCFFYLSGPFANSSEIHFHDDWANDVTSRVHVIQLTGTIFELNSCIKETNVLTKFQENWAKNVTSSVHMFSLYTYREKCS